MKKLKGLCDKIANKAAVKELMREIDRGMIMRNEIADFTTFPIESLMAMLEKNKAKQEDIVKVFEDCAFQGQSKVAYFSMGANRKGGKGQLHTIIDNKLRMSECDDAMRTPKTLPSNMTHDMSYGFQITRSEKTERLMGVRSGIEQMIGGKFRAWKKAMMADNTKAVVPTGSFFSKTPDR